MNKQLNEGISEAVDLVLLWIVRHSASKRQICFKISHLCKLYRVRSSSKTQQNIKKDRSQQKSV
jgi:hypothetical protein